ncbi:hypothetical protein CSUB01_12634 [Colletotrichum sublineola]|uniref:Uncharacterized protein n=1 Tax=Colletotrichum sublineola TaxID=1173701 RepID=A0A066XNZ1_COLSU|nr:hypothetical protein CSUB01_12634 [Colletotrichum sublineola]
MSGYILNMAIQALKMLVFASRLATRFQDLRQLQSHLHGVTLERLEHANVVNFIFPSLFVVIHGAKDAVDAIHKGIRPDQKDVDIVVSATIFTLETSPNAYLYVPKPAQPPPAALLRPVQPNDTSASTILGDDIDLMRDIDATEEELEDQYHNQLQIDHEPSSAEPARTAWPLPSPYTEHQPEYQPSSAISVMHPQPQHWLGSAGGFHCYPVLSVVFAAPAATIAANANHYCRLNRAAVTLALPGPKWLFLYLGSVVPGST